MWVAAGQIEDVASRLRLASLFDVLGLFAAAQQVAKIDRLCVGGQEEEGAGGGGRKSFERVARRRQEEEENPIHPVGEVVAKREILSNDVLGVVALRRVSRERVWHPAASVISRRFLRRRGELEELA